ncbi:purine-cytosine permease family protein [Streptomyces sp. NPDC055078]
MQATTDSDSDWSENREDYALRPVPAGYQQWSVFSLFGVMFGITTAMFFFSWGGTLVHAYGTRNLLIGMGTATLVVGVLAYLWTSAASRSGLASDLLTRGAGFGFLGSTGTSLIYTLNTLIFFAFEGAIMANAVMAQWPHIPSWVVYLATGGIFIPLAWYGMRLMNILMWITLPVFLVFLALTIWNAADTSVSVDFWSYEPAALSSPDAGPAILQVMAAALGVAGTIPVAADIGRFIPAKRRRIGAFIVGPVFAAATFLGPTLLGAWLSLRFGESDPGRYLPAVFGVWGVVFVITTQLRINLSNAYSASLQFAGLFNRVFRVTPGRHWFVVLTVGLGTVLMFGDLYSRLNAVLTFGAVFMTAWIAAVVSDIVINKGLLRISPQGYEYRRARLPHVNPVGIGAITGALVLTVPLAFGIAGPFGKTLAPFISAAIAFVLAPVIALATGGRHYTAASTATDHPAPGQVACVVCAEEHAAADIVTCPFHRGAVCSVCCASERACKSLCKTEAPPETTAAPAGERITS